LHVSSDPVALPIAPPAAVDSPQRRLHAEDASLLLAGLRGCRLAFVQVLGIGVAKPYVLVQCRSTPGLFQSISLYPAYIVSSCISHAAQPADHPQLSGACRLISMNSIVPRIAPTNAAPPPTAQTIRRALLEECHPRERLSPALKSLACRQCLCDLTLRQPTCFLPHLLRHGRWCGLHLCGDDSIASSRAPTACSSLAIAPRVSA
jgi:hypothetical protein